MFPESYARAESMRDQIQIAKLSPYLFVSFCALCNSTEFFDSDLAAGAFAKVHVHLEICDDSPVPFEFARECAKV